VLSLSQVEAARTTPWRGAAAKGDAQGALAEIEREKSGVEDDRPALAYHALRRKADPTPPGRLIAKWEKESSFNIAYVYASAARPTRRSRDSTRRSITATGINGIVTENLLDKIHADRAGCRSARSARRRINWRRSSQVTLPQVEAQRRADRRTRSGVASRAAKKGGSGGHSWRRLRR
jgi:hypothetical protein